MKIVKAKPLFVPGLDALRALAAFWVVLGHARNFFFVDYAEVSSPNLFTKIAYLFSGLGHEAVMIFFVLSGVLVGGRVVAARRLNRWSWSRYLIERCTRLCLVLWPALVLTFALDLVGQAWFGTAGIYGGIAGGGGDGSNIITHATPTVTSLKIYLANAFFLQGIFTPTAGTNLALWSLSNEFWYYILFPILLGCFWPKATLKVRAIHFLALALVIALLGKAALWWGFPIWILGVLSVELSGKPVGRKSKNAFLGVGLFGLVGALLASRFHWDVLGQSPDNLIGVATAVFAIGILQVQGRPKSKVFDAVHFVSNISYSWYLTHLPLLVFIRAAVSSPRWQPSLLTFAYATAFVLFTVAWAWLVYALTEKHTAKVKAWLLGFTARPRRLHLADQIQPKVCGPHWRKPPALTQKKAAA